MTPTNWYDAKAISALKANLILDSWTPEGWLRRNFPTLAQYVTADSVFPPTPLPAAQGRAITLFRYIPADRAIG